MFRAATTAFAALLLSAAPLAAEVRVAMAGGSVSISAQNATVAQILAEWARIGKTRILNADRVGGAPLTLELNQISEIDALNILLRNAGGYVVAPRVTPVPDASKYDRILIVVATSPVVNTPAARPPAQTAAAAPTFTPARPAIPVTPGGDTDDPQPPERQGLPAPARPPAFAAVPQPAQPRPEGEAAPAPAAGSQPFGGAVGMSRPGLFAPPPPVQGRPPNNPGAPQQ